ncbi:hypothetical protein C5S31_04495, partial [ANME-1 cluster archaeon GoMg2]|nr:hypothetical protein [ANME-1 cluster archaeon GoMg2]
LVIVASSVAMYSATDVGNGISEGGGNGVIALVTPPFIGVAGAAEAMGAGSAFPEDEAGISAYVNTNQTIDLEKLKTIFTEVEEVGDNYIVGLTPIPDFGGNINVTVYADTSGWIVAFFKKDEPAAMMMQWGKDTDVDNPQITEIKSTTLEDAITKAADAADIIWTVKDIKYYDFEYPDADGMTLFVRTRATEGTNSTQVEVPATYTLYEASYYHYIFYYGSIYYPISCWNSTLTVDEITISDASTNVEPKGNKWWRVFDSYGPYITTETLHKIEISYKITENYGEYATDIGSSGVATVLIYRTA